MKESITTVEKPLILIAEDLENNFLFLQIVLSKKYNIIWAKDGREAIDLFQEKTPNLILMDIKMPNIDGLEATKTIRAISPEIPIIAQTANAFESDCIEAREAGCSDIITKPIKISILNAIIEKHLLSQQEGHITIASNFINNSKEGK